MLVRAVPRPGRAHRAAHRSPAATAARTRSGPSCSRRSACCAPRSWPRSTATTAVEQYFGRAYEFGYSFSVEETFEKWGREETLGDVVRVVRSFRPDVMLTLPLGGARAAASTTRRRRRLAREAFRAAADPARFPEQLARACAPWQARKIYQGGVGGGTRRRRRGAPAGRRAHRRSTIRCSA